MKFLLFPFALGLVVASGVAVAKVEIRIEGGPGPAAFEACQGKGSGDACTVKTPRGEIEGRCALTGQGTVCAPPIERRPRPGHRGSEGQSGGGPGQN